MNDEISKSREGHRKRLRNRFVQSGLEGFLDYEIVELLLTLGTPRKDCKQMAKNVIKHFGNLRNVLDATFEDLQSINGIGPSNAFGIKLFRSISERYTKEKITERTALSNSEFAADYLKQKIGKEKKEHFYIILLDSRNNLIKDIDISIGTLNANLVHPREVFKEAVQASAAGIIISHNHPSGNPEPSPEDIAMTKRLWEASKIFEIDLLDHIVVTSDNFVSLKERGFL